LGPNPLAPGDAGGAHKLQVFIPRSAAHIRVWRTVRDRPPAARSIVRRASIGKAGEWGKGARGQGARMEGQSCGEIHGRGNGGRDAYLSRDAARRRSRNIPNPGLEVGVEIRRPEAGAGSQSRIADGIELSERNTCRCAMPILLGTLSPQFKQLHARSSCAPATVRYTRVQKGGGAMGALQRARRTGAFEHPEAHQVHLAGARSPSSAGTPFAVTGGHLALF
jgi:hypothetical protein